MTFSRDSRLRPVDYLVHAIVARAIAWFEKTDEFKVVRRLYPNDERALHILRRSMGELYESRAASVPAGQGGTWGTQLSPTDGYALLASMGPAGGAGAQLFKRSVQLSFGNASALNVPGWVSAAADAPFVGPSGTGVIPVRQGSLTNTQLTPFKLASIMTFSRELFQYSLPNIEASVRQILTEAVALDLDTVLLDATASSTIRPAGLRNGVSGSTVTTATAGISAMERDLGILAQAVSAVASGEDTICYIAPPGEYVKIRHHLTDLPFPVFKSSGLAAGFVVCVAANALATAMGDIRFEVSDQAVLHMEDTSPAPLATTSSPIVSPIRSLWQTDCLGIRMLFDVDWAVRNAAAVSWCSAVIW